MIRLLILVLWSSTGIATAALLTPAQVGRMAWAPAAAIFGPLWLAVAVEQRGAQQ